MKNNLLFISILALMTILVYTFDVASNKYVLLIPVSLLAVFQLIEKKSKDK